MIRMSSSRSVQTTTINDPSVLRPTVTNRYSASAEESSMVTATGSSRTPSPSDSDTPCFFRFSALFLGSNVAATGAIYAQHAYLSMRRDDRSTTTRQPPNGLLRDTNAAEADGVCRLSAYKGLGARAARSQKPPRRQRCVGARPSAHCAATAVGGEGLFGGTAVHGDDLMRATKSCCLRAVAMVAILAVN